MECTFRKYYEPCYRDDLESVSLVRLSKQAIGMSLNLFTIRLIKAGSGKSGELRVAFKNYHYISLDSAPKVVEIKWQLPIKSQLRLPTWLAPCRAYTPRHGDFTHEEWQIEGRPEWVDLPAYASSDHFDLTNRLETFIEACRPAIQEHMLAETQDEIARLTFNEAIRYARVHGSKIVTLALRVRTTAILSAGWGSIVGSETLGTPLVDSANYGFMGERPTPVALAHQEDVIFVNAMERDERAIVKMLRGKIFQKDPKPWYEIYLTYFIMITHLTFIHFQALNFMKCRQKTVITDRVLMNASGLMLEQDSEWQVSFIVKKQIEKWDYSANNMLHHFRSILRGYSPFSVAQDNIEELQTRAMLDDDAVIYIEHVLRLIATNGKNATFPAKTLCLSLYRQSESARSRKTAYQSRARRQMDPATVQRAL